MEPPLNGHLDIMNKTPCPGGVHYREVCMIIHVYTRKKLYRCLKLNSLIIKSDKRKFQRKFQRKMFII